MLWSHFRTVSPQFITVRASLYTSSLCWFQLNIAPIPCYRVGHFQAEIWKISETRRIHSSRRRPLKTCIFYFTRFWQEKGTPSRWSDLPVHLSFKQQYRHQNPSKVRIIHPSEKLKKKHPLVLFQLILESVILAQNVLLTTSLYWYF